MQRNTTLNQRQARLDRVAGQLADISRKVADGHKCLDILMEIAAVQAALSEIGSLIVAAHVQQCLTDADTTGRKCEQRWIKDSFGVSSAQPCGRGMDVAS